MMQIIHAGARKVLQHEIGDFSGPVAMHEERFVAAARNSVEEKGNQKEK